MNTRTLKLKASAFMIPCLLGVASAQGAALNELLGASSEEMRSPAVSAGVATNSGDEFAYIDKNHVIPKQALQTALKYYKANRKKISNPYYLSVIDFSQRASSKRLYVVNMRNGGVERFLVAHGKGSDPRHTGYATYFSNKANTHASSLGFYKTGGTYNGDNGYSLLLDGLSPTNSNARAREIVLHGAPYVSALGRSWGCPAVEPSQRTRLINMVKGGSVIYAYHKDFSSPKDGAVPGQDASQPAAAGSGSGEFPTTADSAFTDHTTNSPGFSGESADENNGGSCATRSVTMSLRGRTVTLPARGVWTLESHLATNDDSFSGRFPRTTTENISQHITRSCTLLQRAVPGAACGRVYDTRWDKEWTPPENGRAGQGAVGDKKPSAAEEMWIFNMMWVGNSAPKPGTKFLASYNGKNVVVVGGYEIGPASGRFLGGFQKEVLWYLGAEEGVSKVKLSALKDQSLKPGPVNCGM